MPHWTRALKPHQDEETGETILFYPCPQLPNDLTLAIIRQADGGRTIHNKKLKTCLEEMLEKYTIEVEYWDDELDDFNEKDRLWVTEAYNSDEAFVNFHTPFSDIIAYVNYERIYV